MTKRLFRKLYAWSPAINSEKELIRMWILEPASAAGSFTSQTEISSCLECLWYSIGHGYPVPTLCCVRITLRVSIDEDRVSFSLPDNQCCRDTWHLGFREDSPRSEPRVAVRFVGSSHYYNLEPSGYLTVAESNGTAVPLSSLLKEEEDGYCVLWGELSLYSIPVGETRCPSPTQHLLSFYLALSDAVLSPGLDRDFTHGSFTSRLQL